MFARLNRFSFKRGAPRNTYSALLFSIRYEKNVEGIFRCAVVVGKKVDKRAVVRNNINRRIVAEIRKIVALETSYNVVIIAKKNIKNVESEIVAQELGKIFKLLNIK